MREEQVRILKTMNEATNRMDLNMFAQAVNLTLADNESAKQVLGDKTLKLMAHELVDMIRGNVTIDWTIRENVQAKLRVMVKKLLKRHGYPPDMQEHATQIVLDQAKLLCKDWAEPKN